MTGSETLLIVDDDPNNLELLRDILTLQGYSIECATNGYDALDIARRLVPDLIILDVAMPRMNGYELCGNLKGDTLLKDIPVIFISGYATAVDKAQAFDIGAVDYISKPFEAMEVLSRVKIHCQLAIN